MSEQGRFLYLQWDDKFKYVKPYQAFLPLPEGVSAELQQNIEFSEGQAEVVGDLRKSKESFTLDKHGFQVCKFNHSLPQAPNASLMEEVYLPQVLELLKREVPETERSKVFDWRMR